MNPSAYEAGVAGAINPAVLAAVPANMSVQQPALAVNPAQLIASLSRQQKMDDQRQAARIHILQQPPYNIYPAFDRPTPRHTPKPDSVRPRPSPAPIDDHPTDPTSALNPSTTRVTIVPLLTSPTTIPALSPHEVDDIKAWMAIDNQYESVYRGMRDRMRKELSARPRGWWEKGFVVPGAQPGDPPPASRFRRGREVFEVRYPRRKDRDRRRGKREGLRL